MTSAVIRNWQATVAQSDIAAWKNTFVARVLPQMRSLDGFGGITVMTERNADPCRMTVQTRWRDMAAVRKFAGDDPAQTYLPDFMAPFFPQYDERATFYDEVLIEGPE